MKRTARALALVAILLSVRAYAEDAAQIQLALVKLTHLGSALYVAAHPDDENTAFISYISNGRLFRAGYLAMAMSVNLDLLVPPATRQ